MARQLVSSAEAVRGTAQHTAPCSDCPFARTALNGWLGGTPVDEWLRLAHSDGPGRCHVVDNMQCAGLAIYRANAAKVPRDPATLKLPADRARVFTGPAEFTEHHKKLPGSRPVTGATRENLDELRG